MKNSSFNIILKEFEGLVNKNDFESFNEKFKQQLAKNPKSVEVFKDRLQDLLDICYEDSFIKEEQVGNSINPSVDLPELFDLNQICKLLKIQTGTTEYKNFKSKLTYDRNNEILCYEKIKNKKKYRYTSKTIKNYLKFYFPNYHTILVASGI